MSARPADARRAAIVAAATAVFARYGFKKASMDELARAADLSRPGLYLHFASKELLFRAVIEDVLGVALARAVDALAGPGPLEDRLVEAFVAAHWLLVRSLDPRHAAELLESAQGLAAEALAAQDRALRAAVAGAVAPVAGRASPQDVADLLDAVSAGLKHRAADVEGYRAELRRLVRVVVACAA